MSEALRHGRNCDGLRDEEDCTCGLRWRIDLQTEQELHAAWRKRAEEAETNLRSLSVASGLLESGIADLQSQLARANETADAKAAAAFNLAEGCVDSANCPKHCERIRMLTPADASRALAEQIRKAKLEELNNLLAITQEPISQAEKVAKVAQRIAELSREP